MTTPTPDPGSFRDPLSRVHVDESAAWRGLAAEGLADFEAFAATTTFREAIAAGSLVATELVDPQQSPLGGDWAAVLRHERIEVISYPYEWAFEMLRDAALLQLDLSRRALDEGILTKDATSYNVQFVGSRPVFVDVGSFERVRSGEPWPGYRQFCELFLNPLVIQALGDVDFQPLLRGSVHGISPSDCANLLRPRDRRRRGILTHVALHARAERRYADADADRDVKAELKQAGFGPAIVKAQLQSLERSVRRLRWKAQASTWSDYGSRSHYTDDDLRMKEEFVAQVAESDRPGLVLDLGANDGRFSRIAVERGGGRAVAVDSDHLVIDTLYRQLRDEGNDRILPLVLDLSDPSPGIGWRNVERRRFVDRVRPDLVLCLAVVHHLALTNTVPFDEIVAFLADFGAPLVVEFPHRDDPMAARLLGRKRDGLFDHYDVPQWEKALESRFRVVTRTPLPSGRRTLYRCTPA